MCQKPGPQLGQSEGELYRQVTQWLEEEGEPSSQSFDPWRDIDEGCLSVDRSSKTTPAAAYKLFSDPKPSGYGQASRGVWALTVAEVDSVGLSAWEDPEAPSALGPANPAHAVIEFGGLGTKARKSAARRLKVLALLRGRLYPP